MPDSPLSRLPPARRPRAVRPSALLSAINTPYYSQRILLSLAKGSIPAVDITINISTTVSSLSSNSLLPSPRKRAYLS
jgi:hypothetical protein